MPENSIRGRRAFDSRIKRRQSVQKLRPFQGIHRARGSGCRGMQEEAVIAMNSKGEEKEVLSIR